MPRYVLVQPMNLTDVQLHALVTQAFTEGLTVTLYEEPEAALALHKLNAVAGADPERGFWWRDREDEAPATEPCNPTE